MHQTTKKKLEKQTGQKTHQNEVEHYVYYVKKHQETQNLDADTMYHVEIAHSTSEIVQCVDNQYSQKDTTTSTVRTKVMIPFQTRTQKRTDVISVAEQQHGCSTALNANDGTDQADILYAKDV